MTTIVIPGRPRVWQRAVALAGGKHLTPRSMRDDKKTLAWYLRAEFPKPIDGPVRLDVVAVFPLAKSKSRKRKPPPRGWHSNTPDGDNLLKIIMDAGNGVAWQDDRQIADMRCRKVVGAQGEVAHTTIEIAELTDA